MGTPPSDPATPHRLTTELRADRAARRDPGAHLVPVTGGEPLPAEETAPTERPGPCP